MINFPDYKKISYRVEDCQTGTLLFYYISSQDSLKKFHERVAHLDKVSIIINEKIKNINNLKANIICVDKEKWFELKRKACDYFYPVNKRIYQIAITGTNGKTTTTFLGMSLSNFWNQRALYIGTLGIYLDGVKILDNKLTTPDLIFYRELIYNLRDQVDILWVELSSHALEQDRLSGVMFDATGWTSFSQDHLDYHKTMDDYLNSKKKIFSVSKIPCLLSQKIEGIDGEVLVENYSKNYEDPFLKIEYNQNNFNLAYEILRRLLGLPLKKVTGPFNVPGRFDTYFDTRASRYYIVDYAHTPDAVDKVLKEVGRLWPLENILSIIGCGGNRDSSKRILMSRVACDLSHRVIFTEDNSRSEKVSDIISEMTKNLSANNFNVIEDRKKAIISAVKDYNECKIVVVLGKGEEETIDRGFEVIKHSDKSFIREMTHD